MKEMTCNFERLELIALLCDADVERVRLLMKIIQADEQKLRAALSALRG